MFITLNLLQQMYKHIFGAKYRGIIIQGTFKKLLEGILDWKI